MMTAPPIQTPVRLFTREFVALSVITGLTFCNIALFFEFQDYLQNDMGVPLEKIGLLIGLFALTGLMLRPLISPFLHGGNARKWVYVGAAGTLVSLLTYSLALGVSSMAVVRIFHGGMYVLLGTAVTTRLVVLIPRERSGEAFGLFAVVTLLPYAVIPPLIPVFKPMVGGFLGELNLMAFLMVLVFPVLYFATPGSPKTAKGPAETPPTAKEIMANLLDPHIVALLFISLVIFTTFAPLFYFLKGYGDHIGISDPGLFFTLSIATEIGVRIIGGKYFDKVNKLVLFAGSLAGLGVGYLLLGWTSSALAFFALGFLFGLAWGVIMPLANSLIFDFSRPRFRALNTNLGFEMYQAGLLIGPIMGSWIIGSWGYRPLYYGCAVMTFAAFLACMYLVRAGNKP